MDVDRQPLPADVQALPLEVWSESPHAPGDTLDVVEDYRRELARNT